MSRTSASIRRAAVKALGAWAKGHVYADTLVAEKARNLDLSPSDRGLLNAIVLGVLRNKRLLDHWISGLRKGKLDDETRDFLRIGLCQLFILEISEHAALNETVEAAPQRTRGLVNGVLRTAQREGVTPSDELAIQHSHPDWLVQKWAESFGEDKTLSLLKWNNQPAPTIARLNPLRPDKHQDILESEKVHSIDSAPGFLEIKGNIPREWLKEGSIYIQDLATRHCITLLAPKPGEVVIDACAAPGGKAALAAAAMHNEGRLICTDSNKKRLPRLLENLTNLGITIAETSSHDWTQAPPPELINSCDAILLDVPCSNTGVLRRRVDARWRLSPEDITAITVIQRKILTHALQAVKSGGRIVYSTCSIDSEENSQLIKEFIAKNSDVSLSQEIQIFPHEHQTDGAYAALLIKH